MCLRVNLSDLTDRILFFCRVSVVCLMSSSLLAEGTVLEIEGATIRGNQELPTVLYVVPWKPAKVFALDEPQQSLASLRPISTIDRSSFKRVLRYHQQFLLSEELPSNSQGLR